MSDLSDEELVTICQAELPYNSSTFEVLLRRHEESIFRTCRRYLGPNDAEDAAQEVFLRIFHGVKTFRGDSKFKTWLYRLVSNVCATRYAKRKKHEEKMAAFTEATGRELVQKQEAPATKPGPMAEAMSQLADEDRQVLILRHVSDLSVPEIAEVSGISLSAAKMRVSRAEKRLKAVYETTSGKKQKTKPDV